MSCEVVRPKTESLLSRPVINFSVPCVASVKLAVLPFRSQAVSEELCLLNDGVALSLAHLFLRPVGARVRVEPEHMTHCLNFLFHTSPEALFSSSTLPQQEAAFPPAPPAHTATIIASRPAPSALQLLLRLPAAAPQSPLPCHHLSTPRHQA